MVRQFKEIYAFVEIFLLQNFFPFPYRLTECTELQKVTESTERKEERKKENLQKGNFMDKMIISKILCQNA